jgi:hypothetical protein
VLAAATFARGRVAEHAVPFVLDDSVDIGEEVGAVDLEVFFKYTRKQRLSVTWIIFGADIHVEMFVELG